MKKIGSLEITRYNYELIDGEPKIVISMVKSNLNESKNLKLKDTMLLS